MPRIVHFEIPADNLERAVDFYSKVFDWKADKWEGPMEYWLVTTGEKDQPGIDGAIMPRGEEGGVINTIDVPSIDEFIEKIEAAGGEIVQPKTPIPGVGWMAYFKDTEGNKVGIYTTDMSVK